MGRKPMSLAQYQAARKHAQQLPVSPLGASRQTSGPKSPFVPGTWTNLGPAPPNVINPGAGFPPFPISGEIAAVALDPADATSKTIWIGTTTGWIWNTTDGSAHWTPRGDLLTSLAINSIAIDGSTHPSTIYAGTGDVNDPFSPQPYNGVGLLKSTDGGTTWTLSNPDGILSGVDIDQIAIDPNNPSTLLLADSARAGGFSTNAGIFRSTDGGASFTQVIADVNNSIQGPAGGGTAVVFDPANPNYAFAVIGDSVAQNPTSLGGIWESTDNGVYFTQVSTDVPTGSDVQRGSLAFSHDGTKLYAAFADGDYRDSSNGAVLPFSRPHMGELLNGDIYTGAVNLTNGATAWTAHPVNNSNVQTDSGNRNYWNNLCAGVDPSDTTNKTVYLCATGLWKSTDGGGTWDDVVLNLPDFAGSINTIWRSSTVRRFTIWWAIRASGPAHPRARSARPPTRTTTAPD